MQEEANVPITNPSEHIQEEADIAIALQKHRQQEFGKHVTTQAVEQVGTFHPRHRSYILPSCCRKIIEDMRAAQQETP